MQSKIKFPMVVLQNTIFSIVALFYLKELTYSSSIINFICHNLHKLYFT